jgi:DNA repair protein RadC
MKQTDTIQLRELTVHYTLRTDRLGQPTFVGSTIWTPADCARIFNVLLQDEASEVFIILCLSTKHQVIAFHEVSRGALDSTTVHPREVFKAALLANAFAIVVGHNHPSGDPTPSVDDIRLTSSLVAAGTLLGVPVLDHIVIGTDRFISMKEAGLLHT